jgi:tripartite ATP-independent transporter DctM subunit
VTPLEIGAIVAVVTLLVLASGVPIAFGLGIVAMLFLLIFEGPAGLSFVGEVFFSSLSDFTLVAIPMFIVMGSAIASSPAGADLYSALERWLGRLPGGLVIANLAACTLFAALSGSSPATCAAIGKMGIPEMRNRGYPAGLSAGAIAAGGTLGILIPPSVTMIVYGIATGTSIGRLFIAGLVPGVLLTGLFILWAWFASAKASGEATVTVRRYRWREKLEALPRVFPFLAIVAGILYVLYGGIATPSEAAGVGAVLCLVFVGLCYRRWQPRQILSVFSDSMREAGMIMMIIAAAGLFSYMLSSLFITQTLAENIAVLDVNRWVLLAIINLFLLVAGFFLPPVAVILMTAPILLPIINGAGFDPYWFAVIMTINLEIGLITPPVGLNLYVIKGIAPDLPLKTVLGGALPFVLMMVLGIVLISIFPGIVSWLPDLALGAAR